MKLNIDGVQIEIVNGTIHINTKQDSANVQIPRYESDTTQPAIKHGDVAAAVRSLKVGESKTILAHTDRAIRSNAWRFQMCVSVKQCSRFEFIATRLH